MVSKNNCRWETYPAVPPSTCYNDGRPFSCGGSPSWSRKSATTPTAPDADVHADHGRDVRWNGCVGSRAYPLNIKDENYSIRVPGIMGATCGSPVLEMTHDSAAARTMVNGLVTNGETYIPSGLVWGWRMLSPQEPFAAGTGGPGGARKAIILVTDGRNTLAPNYPEHNAYDGPTADRLTREACANVAADKANAIKIYTIAFEVDGLDVKSILQNCAGATGGEFYDATNAAALATSLGPRHAVDLLGEAHAAVTKRLAEPPKMKSRRPWKGRRLSSCPGWTSAGTYST